MDEVIHHLKSAAYKVPTDSPESDGTAQWDSTTLILVELGAGGLRGIGYSYAHEACIPLIRQTLFPLIAGRDVNHISARWMEMVAAIRNFGRRGIASSAMAAVEIALWDLKAKLLKISILDLLGAVREKIPAYGSGGFTSYSEKQLRGQMEKWVSDGMFMVKMKVGRESDRDETRVAWVRDAIGARTGLFTDANGAYTPRQAVAMAQRFLAHNVSWFEEPVSSDDLEGLKFVKGHSPAAMEIAAGEYNYDVWQARQMLEQRAVGTLQADATRCGVLAFFQMAELCEAFQVPLSAHTAPALHAHLCCVARRAEHVEYFHDHVRVEQLFFDGATIAQANGYLQPNRSQPGFGLDFKYADAAKYQISV